MAMILSSQCAEPVTPAQLLGEDEPERDRKAELRRQKAEMKKAAKKLEKLLAARKRRA